MKSADWEDRLGRDAVVLRVRSRRLLLFSAAAGFGTCWFFIVVAALNLTGVYAVLSWLMWASVPVTGIAAIVMGRRANRLIAERHGLPQRYGSTLTRRALTDTAAFDQWLVAARSRLAQEPSHVTGG